MGTLWVGYDSASYGTMRTYIKPNSLGNLGKSDVIVNATLNLAYDSYSGIPDSFVVSLHEVTSSWNSSITWDTQPSYSSNVTDYTRVYRDRELSGGYASWDVTKLAKQMFEGKAMHGFMLKAAKEVTSGPEIANVRFYSVNHPSQYATKPFFVVTYRNNKGLESYWTFHEHGVGRAGTGYINDYSGNLVFVHSDLATGGTRLPVNISHVYNGYMAKSQFSSYFMDTRAGYGWKLNMIETLDNPPSGVHKSFKARYTDSDGTEHYFYEKENGEIVDEDGLGLKLSYSDGEFKYCITDKSNNKKYFDSYGRLLEIKDSNGNSINLKYESNKLTKIIDGDGRSIYLYYNSHNHLKELIDQSGRKTTYYYSTTYNGTTSSDNSGYLRKITYPDGTSTLFDYNSDGTLKKVTDATDYALEYTYTNDTAKRVSTVKEKSGSNTGQTLKVHYRNNSTFFQTSGKDDIIDTAGDIVNVYQFDNWGRTISVLTETATGETTRKTHGAVMYEYIDVKLNEGGDNKHISQINKLKTGAVASKPIDNILRNHSAEKDGSWSASILGDDIPGGYTTSLATDQKYIGNRSFKVEVTKANSSIVRFRQDHSNLSPGTYTFSSYVKTSNVSSDNYGAFLRVYIFKTDGSDESFFSDYIDGTTTTAIDNGWKRLSVTFTIPDNGVSSVSFSMGIRNSTGKAWFDALQLEKEDAPSMYNMLENSSFENDADSWSVYASDGISTISKEGSYSIKCTGDYSRQQNIIQSVKVNERGLQTFIVSGWAKANSVPTYKESSRRFSLGAVVKYTDYSYRLFEFPFNPDIPDWQFVSGVVVPDENKTVESIDIYLGYHYNMNSVYFDNISLIRDNAPSYTYDDNGNVSSVRATAEKKSTFEYDSNNNLTKIYNDVTGYDYKYKYDSKNNLTKATNEKGTDYHFTYNSYGHPTSFKVQKAGETKALYSSASYSYSSPFKYTVTDYRGKETEYVYSPYRGLLNYVTDPNGNRTAYIYDNNNDNLRYVYLDKNKDEVRDSGEPYVRYSYTNNRLSSIYHNGISYGFTYDQFGNTKNVNVDGYSLISYTYGDYNGKLKRATYGNGHYYENVYDHLERIIGIKYNGSLDYEWKYNALGDVHEHIDNENNVIYNYEYDSIGRLIRQFSKDKSTKKGLLNFQTVYDKLNRVKNQKYTFGDETASTSYIYEEDNLIDKMTYSTNIEVDLSYDSLMRKTGKKLGHPYITQYLSEKYIYWLGEGGPDARRTTLKRIEYENRNADGTESKSTTSYEYDDVGNITKISEDGVEKVRYYYDELNQLIREDNKYLAIPGHSNFGSGKTIRYIYDRGGNIDYINEYAYTTGTPGTVIDRIEYSYNHPVNKNVLTNYNGQSISVDNVGNPTTYLGYTMTWEKGRRLSTISGNGLDVSYKYDVNGIRTQKTVNGVTTKYYTDGSNIVNERKGLNSIWYFYDENGTPIGMKYNSDDYYFQKNAQGDIIRMYDSDANLVGQYVYDTWGKVIKVLDGKGNNVEGNSSHIANRNPFRYRGYYYDVESGLFYVGSRYYDPEIGRFINADDTDVLFEDQDSLIENNLYAYCLNNPVNMIDEDGYMATAVAASGFLAYGAAAGGANFWNPVGWAILGTVAVVAVGVGVYYGVKVYQAKKADKPKKKQAKKTGKEKASDAPSWAKGKKPNKGEKADDFAKRILNDKYGKGKWKNGPGSEFSEIKKWAQRSLGIK